MNRRKTSRAKSSLENTGEKADVNDDAEPVPVAEETRVTFKGHTSLDVSPDNSPNHDESVKAPVNPEDEPVVQ